MENRASVGLNRTQILALDIGASCGYYSVHGSGTWNFHPARGRNDNKPYLAYHTTLKEFIQRHGIRKIVTEDINFNAHNYDYRKLNELRGILLLIVEELNLLPVEFVNVRVLKKWATGSGVATKGEMVTACVNHYRLLPRSHDEADAILLFHYYCRKWRIN